MRPRKPKNNANKHKSETENKEFTKKTKKNV